MMPRSHTLSDIFFFIVLVCLLGGSAYYVYTNRPCAQPIQYKVGEFDTRFGISQTDFIADAQKAADIWNTEAGHMVLQYSAGASMPMNLIYDNRQIQTNIGKTISQQQDEVIAEKANIAALQSNYDALKQKYQNDKAGGVDVATLNSEVDYLNASAAQLQDQVRLLNAQIDQVNSNAVAFNTQAGVDFEEGDYVKQFGVSRIDLFEFKNNTQLIRLMAHEFGHSLGLDHNTNPDAIMYPENTATTLSLSTDDKAELQTRCALSFTNLNPFQNLKLPGFLTNVNLRK